MSQEKVEVVRAIYDAFNRGDTDAILELVDPAVSVEDRAVIDGATYEGRDGALRFLAFQAEAFNAQSVELEELVDTTDEIVAVIRLRGEGPRSGVPLQDRVALAANAHRFVLDDDDFVPRFDHLRDLCLVANPAAARPSAGSAYISVRIVFPSL